MAKTDPQDVEAKPEYGPVSLTSPVDSQNCANPDEQQQLMSPAIFRNKWLARFRDLIYYDETHAEAKATSTLLEWKCHTTWNEIFEVSHFYLQAEDHSLAIADFPPEPKPSKRREDPPYVRKAALVAKVNPFFAASYILNHADLNLYRLRKCKYGERLYGQRWQALPLAVRQRMNEVFERVAKAEEDGS